MNVLEIKKNIESLTVSIADQQRSLAILRQQIVTAIKPFVKERIKYEVEHQVKTNSEHTKALGKDALTEMKKQLQTALENSDAVIDGIFGDDTLWVHVNYQVVPNGDRFSQSFNNQNAAGEKIRKGIKIAVGEAGKILVDYKYLPIGNLYVWDSGMRYDYTRANQGQSKLMYAYALALPQELETLIGKYSKGVGLLHDASCKLMDLQKTLSQQEAMDLWNEV